MAGGGWWEDKAEVACDNVLALEQEAASLRAIPAGSRTAAQEQRLAELNVELARASSDLDRLLDDLSRQLGSKDPRVKRLRSADRITASLAQLPGTVAIYTVVAEERFWTVVISSTGRAAYSSPIRAEALNRKVLDFRAVLYNPKQDPRPLARELYDIILGTARANPMFANATTLLWSFDGVLRYVPAAALHDGQGYLVERYRNVVFNRASAETLADAPSGRLEGVGLGVAQKVGSFAPLPSVADELRGIFVDAALVGDPGAVPGRVLLDTSFTEPALETALRDGHSVVHIATHFQLSPGSARDSLLLLGDGSLVNVGDIRDIRGGFRGVELLTLSACNTAASGATADGKEVECFGTIAQERGAKAVIASLWPVSDRSTSALMQTFYRLRAASPAETKAELLRRAQTELLTGRLSVPAGTAADRALVHEEGPAVSGQPPFTPDPAAPFAHPYYWAPFVLIGNCR
jgi:CHAT domain-containing protein